MNWWDFIFEFVLDFEKVFVYFFCCTMELILLFVTVYFLKIL